MKKGRRSYYYLRLLINVRKARVLVSVPAVSLKLIEYFHFRD